MTRPRPEPCRPGIGVTPEPLATFPGPVELAPGVTMTLTREAPSPHPLNAALTGCSRALAGHRVGHHTGSDKQ